MAISNVVRGLRHAALKLCCLGLALFVSRADALRDLWAVDASDQTTVRHGFAIFDRRGDLLQLWIGGWNDRHVIQKLAKLTGELKWRQHTDLDLFTYTL